MAAEFENLSFEEKEQEEIIRLAARLQSEELERLSGRDILAVAAEAGIAPEFVRQAAEQVQAKKKPVRTAPPVEISARPARSTPSVVAMLFMALQLVTVGTTMYGYYFSLTQSPWAMGALALAFALGVDRGFANQRDAARVIFRSTLLLSLLCGLLVRLKWGQVNADWWPALPLFMLLQMFTSVIGSRLATIADRTATLRTSK